jgi:hypothetical protein
MRASIKFAREIANKCFRINEVINGKEYIAVFDTKLCAQLLEEKFTSANSRYAMALRIFEEFLDATDGGINGPFQAYCRDRLDRCQQAGLK